MKMSSILRAAAILGLAVTVSGCGGVSSGKLWGKRNAAPEANPREQAAFATQSEPQAKSTVWDLFKNADDPNVTLAVNKYLWNASLQVLDFLPVQSVDPFSGLIVTGYGTPPGGGRAYKATIHISDPALDARSLKVSLESRGGPVAPETVRAVEDAILARARQLRIQDSNL